MATKSRKNSPRKSSKKSTRKAAASTAQVQLDPATVHQFELHLRQGLIASGAVMMSDVDVRLQTGAKAGAKVELDSDTVARLDEILRNGLVSSGAVLASEFPQTEQAAPAGGGTRSKTTSKSKKRYGSASKKR